MLHAQRMVQIEEGTMQTKTLAELFGLAAVVATALFATIDRAVVAREEPTFVMPEADPFVVRASARPPV